MNWQFLIARESKGLRLWLLISPLSYLPFFFLVLTVNKLYYRSKSLSENLIYIWRQAYPLMVKQIRKSYQSDLSDKKWQMIELHIPKPKTKRGRKREHPLREMRLPTLKGWVSSNVFTVLTDSMLFRILSPFSYIWWSIMFFSFSLWFKAILDSQYL